MTLAPGQRLGPYDHPNICTLYDIGDGYRVMELIDGESLAERLARGSKNCAAAEREVGSAYGTRPPYLS